MSSDSKSTEELAREYESQSLPSVAYLNYTPPTGEEDSSDTKFHTGGPDCYPCCGWKCTAALVAIVAVTVVCCAYASTPEGTCCGQCCYWPF